MESYTEEMFYDAIKNGEYAFLNEVQDAISKFQKEVMNYNQLILGRAYDVLRHISQPIEPEFHKHFNSASARYSKEQREITDLVNKINAEKHKMRRPFRNPDYRIIHHSIILRQQYINHLIDTLYSKYGKTIDDIQKNNT
jgi:hypothetical protein